MGSISGRLDERPVHTVKLNDLYIAKYEVTQALWLEVMGSETGVVTDCAQCAVYDVKHTALDSFIAKLNKLTGKHYRLPTEAEWEYAATGGNKSKGYKYSGSDSLNEVAGMLLTQA